jgi:hypothetical protein
MNNSCLQNGYRRFLAWGMFKATKADEEAIKLQDCQNYDTMAELKRSLLGNLQGRVLEIRVWAQSVLLPQGYPLDWRRVESVYANLSSAGSSTIGSQVD